ncbi:MAG: hypothetical protein DRN81_04360, partial [Thermoproteota archaeon]
ELLNGLKNAYGYTEGRCRTFRWYPPLPTRLTHAVDLEYEDSLPYILVVRYCDADGDGEYSLEELEILYEAGD